MEPHQDVFAVGWSGVFKLALMASTSSASVLSLISASTLAVSSSTTLARRFSTSRTVFARAAREMIAKSWPLSLGTGTADSLPRKHRTPPRRQAPGRL